MANAFQIWMPYFASTMAIVIAIFVAAWLHNRHIDSLTSQFNARIDETNRRIDETNRRIDEFRAEMLVILREMQGSLRDLDRRVTRLEERSAPIVRS